MFVLSKVARFPEVRSNREPLRSEGLQSVLANFVACAVTVHCCLCGDEPAASFHFNSVTGAAPKALNDSKPARRIGSHSSPKSVPGFLTGHYCLLARYHACSPESRRAGQQKERTSGTDADHTWLPTTAIRCRRHASTAIISSDSTYTAPGPPSGVFYPGHHRKRSRPIRHVAPEARFGCTGPNRGALGVHVAAYRWGSQRREAVTGGS